MLGELRVSYTIVAQRWRSSPTCHTTNKLAKMPPLTVTELIGTAMR
jgi:hypothetical protein